MATALEAMTRVARKGVKQKGERKAFEGKEAGLEGVRVIPFDRCAQLEGEGEGVTAARAYLGTRIHHPLFVIRALLFLRFSAARWGS